MPPETVSHSDLTAGFKLAMRRLAATVTIITTRDGDNRHGMAATAVTSVTTTPPTLLICINQSASIHGPLLASGAFCVNLLGTEHAGLVPLFSGRLAGQDRFGHGAWEDGPAGVPRLRDAQASLACTVVSATACGSHTVVLGEVGEIRLSGETRPLLYQEGGLHRTVPV